ncbi:MAG: hypothetical protein ACRC28_02805 [Clostridium sp.]|uniref:hypothetical protein n=1 Tax=Clostridium sp. TaxID=1506 RepID=UPI003F2EA3F2
MSLNSKNNMNMLVESIEKVNGVAKNINEFGKTINGLNETLLKLIENQSISKIEENADGTIKSLKELNKTLDWLNDKNKEKRLEEIEEIKDFIENKMSKYSIDIVNKEIEKTNREIESLRKFISEEIVKTSKNAEVEDKKALGSLYYENEEYEASFEYFNKHILEKIKNGKIPERQDYYNRGKASESLGNIEKAMKDYKKANKSILEIDK